MAGKNPLGQMMNKGKKFMKKVFTMRRGGGLGNTYSFGENILPGAPLGNAQVVVPQSSCMATQRFGEISYPTTGLGLPGMSGGARQRNRMGRFRSSRRRNEAGKFKGSRRRNRFGRYRSSRKRNARGRFSGRQAGGRYSFDLTSPVPGAAAPWAGGIPPVMKIPCEAAYSNPLNPVQMGGVGGVDSAFYAAPTAGYTNNPSTWVGSTGAPSLLQTPYDARTTPPVCFKTGGGRKRSGSKRSGKTRRR
jgi:hypothetical protein